MREESTFASTKQNERWSIHWGAPSMYLTAHSLTHNCSYSYLFSVPHAALCCITQVGNIFGHITGARRMPAPYLDSHFSLSIEKLRDLLCIILSP